MTRIWLAGWFALALAVAAVADDAPSRLDKLDPARLPAAVRPPKGLTTDVIATLGKRSEKVDCLAFRGDGKLLAISGPDQILRIWDLDGLKQTAAAKQPDSVVCLTFTPDNKTLVVGESNGGIRLLGQLDMKMPVARATIPAHKDGPVWSVAVSPDGKTLASGGRDKALRLWDISRPKPTAIATLAGHTGDVRGVAFSPDGKYLVSAGGDEKQIRVWDLSGAEPKAGEVVPTPGTTTGVAFSPDGKTLVTAGARGVPRLWEFKDGKPENPMGLPAGGKAVPAVCFAPDGERLAGLLAQSPTEDRVVVWARDGSKLREIQPDLHMQAVAFAPDGRHLAAVSEIGTLLIRLPK